MNFIIVVLSNLIALHSIDNSIIMNACAIVVLPIVIGLITNVIYDAIYKSISGNALIVLFNMVISLIICLGNFILLMVK